MGTIRYDIQLVLNILTAGLFIVLENMCKNIEQKYYTKSIHQRIETLPRENNKESCTINAIYKFRLNKEQNF